MHLNSEQHVHVKDDESAREFDILQKHRSCRSYLPPNPTAHLLAAKTLEIWAQQSESFRRILRAQLAALGWMGQDMSRFSAINLPNPPNPPNPGLWNVYDGLKLKMTNFLGFQAWPMPIWLHPKHWIPICISFLHRCSTGGQGQGSLSNQKFVNSRQLIFLQYLQLIGFFYQHFVRWCGISWSFSNCASGHMRTSFHGLPLHPTPLKWWGFI